MWLRAHLETIRSGWQTDHQVHKTGELSQNQQQLENILVCFLQGFYIKPELAGLGKVTNLVNFGPSVHQKPEFW